MAAISWGFVHPFYQEERWLENSLSPESLPTMPAKNPILTSNRSQFLVPKQESSPRWPGLRPALGFRSHTCIRDNKPGNWLRGKDGCLVFFQNAPCPVSVLCTSLALQHPSWLWEVWKELELLQSYFGAAQRARELVNRVGEAEAQPTSCLCPQTQTKTGQGSVCNGLHHLWEHFDTSSSELLFLILKPDLPFQEKFRIVAIS